MAEDGIHLDATAEAQEPAVQEGTAKESQTGSKTSRRKPRKSEAAATESSPAVARPLPGSRMQGRVLRLNGTFGFIQ